MDQRRSVITTRTPEAAENGGRERAGVTAAALVVVVFSVVFVARTLVHYRGHPVLALFDDGMISMRYAHNLASGHGLVWNAGQPGVEGYTNFGWTLWMALLHLLGLPGWAIVLMVIASAVGLTVAGLFLVRAVVEELAPGDIRRARAAVWLTALAYPLSFWALRGMEVAALAAATSAMALLVLRLRTAPSDRRLLRRLAGVIVVSVLIRTDAAIVCGIVAAAAVWWGPTAAERRRRLTVVGGALVATLTAHTLFRLAYYGDALPNTYYLKLAGAPLFTRLGRGMASATAQASAGLLPLLLLASGAAWLHLRRDDPSRRAYVLLIASVVAPAAYSVYVGGDAWEWFLIANRYQATSIPVLCVLAAGGLVSLVDAPEALRRRCLMGAAAAIVASVVLAGRNLPPTGSLQYVLPNSRELADRTLTSVVAAVLCIAVGVGRRWAPRTAGAALIVAAALVLDGASVGNWVRTTGPHVRNDATMALYGLVIRDSTAPNATVAVIWAGGTPYYSGRPSIDLLGKSDAKIAHEPPQPVPFYPGHTKWDYAWSIGHLRPDLVADLFYDTPAVDDELRQWGYDNLAPKVWVRHDTVLVDRPALLQGLRANPRIEQLIVSHL